MVQGPGDDVAVAGQRRRVEDRRQDIGQLGAAVDEVKPCGRLLPGVGHDNPERRKRRAQGDQEARQPVGFAGDAVLAVDQNGQETGFEKKGKHALGGERRAEDVAHET